MRQIRSRSEPVAFTEWRASSQNDINYGYDLIPSDLRSAIKDALISDQRGLCAYTGIGIDQDRAHIEHLLPQKHCQPGQEDVAYMNMVSCYPGPNSAYVPYGAVFKADWPTRQEQHLFVSPRSAGCEARFMFSIRGKISAAENDVAASETIKPLVLDHHELEGFRREAISATLDALDLPSARKRLARLQDAENGGGRLEPFCFALKQALRKHITRLLAIREQKRKRRGREKPGSSLLRRTECGLIWPLPDPRPHRSTNGIDRNRIELILIPSSFRLDVHFRPARALAPYLADAPAGGKESSTRTHTIHDSARITASQ
jgi:uncharacterized protein (TIGR02646 family)